MAAAVDVTAVVHNAVIIVAVIVFTVNAIYMMPTVKRATITAEMVRIRHAMSYIYKYLYFNVC